VPNTARRSLQRAPSLTVFPGLSIFVVVVAVNLLGDGLRDAPHPARR
jgi:peptide/nickel transport system permease protein